ncbi:ZYRO0F03366p [Zygosaccharomyces rouxii]|uniref:ZYRO0F03366p n=1 Tax=Zygosaccharomyces rouxii (strain ATCC 2623 / CBS 732 / NBRC 1130 / NCYC 568 / NRRL Y-229) TaxID=559307 RepID=C5DXA0_ZYGRC|nr:uncharacterized protein ZYRO0F03366g [Zygosaccharomyces rouxii]KAH9199175.1 hypothetical protein LQ764DRAFT_213883 [Zygosaccharomyces rouxii]CAR28411.1 ZYRO0F03366p [Zygosaccharomyces rouxii]
MNNLNVLGDSVRGTLGRLRDKHAFLHQQKRYYLDVRSRLLELNTRKNGEDDDDDDDDNHDNTEEKIAETGLEFNDIIISTKRRIFISIGYEYFVERNEEEAVAFADDKLSLISEAIVQFDDKIQEAELTERRIKELAEKGDDFEDEFQGDEEEGLPAMDIREELDEDGNVISSSVTPSANQKTRKELEKTLLGEQHENNEQNGLSDFEKNLKGKLVKKEEEKKKKERQEIEKREREEREKREQEEREKREQEERQREYDSRPPIDMDMENMYTFEDLVREMDERDELEDQLGEDEYLQSEDEDDEDEDEDDAFGYSVIPGSMAQSSFMEQIKKLRRDRLPPPKSILKSRSKDSKPKKSVGFAENADVHEVENLKDANKGNHHNPLLQIDDDGTVLSSEEFDSDLFAKLIGVQGPDEIHERYKEEVETKERQEEERAHSKKRVSRFKLERTSKEENHVEREPAENGSDAAVSDVVEKEDPVAEDPASIEPRFQRSERSGVVSDIVEKEDPVTEEPAYTDPRFQRSGRNEAVSDIVEKEDPVTEKPTSIDPLFQRSGRNEAVSDIVEKEDPVAEKPASIDPLFQRSRRNEAVSDIVENDVDDEGPVFERKLDIDHDLELELDPPHHQKKFILRKPLRSLHKPKRKPQQRPKIEQLDSDEEDDKEIDEAKPLPNENNDDSSTDFPPEVQKAARGPQKPVVIPNVDYKSLGENLDDMARAYALGVYDDDLHDDPGTLVEKLDDFKNYNKQVEQLEDDIKEFRLNNPAQEEVNEDDDDDDNGPLMTDVVEKDLPSNYDEQYDEDEDLSLHPDKLSESVAIDYLRFKESLMKDRFAEYRTDEEKQLEPIDEWGNPVKRSRFKSQRFGLGN